MQSSETATNEALIQENQILRSKIDDFKRQRMNGSNIDGEIKKFVTESEKNINEMSEKVNLENQQRNRLLHQLTVQYEGVLKQQIGLLTVNKDLTARKEKQDEIFNQNIEKMTKEYEARIKEFEEKVKGNVKRIQDMSGSNIINRLLKNERFKTEMIAKGVKVDVLEKQSLLEQISATVEEREVEIAEQEEKSATLDEQLLKTRELIDTMKDLLENMVKQKQNIVKQNSILKEKLQQSEQLIAKLLGQSGQDEEEEEGEEEEDDDEEEPEEGSK